MLGFNMVLKAKEKFNAFKASIIIAIFLFVFGLIVGIFLEHYFVEPVFNKKIHSELAECEIKKDLQEEQLNYYIACLQEKCSLNPNNC
jgi:regulatory protein YycI of two-component signal transduction system YycFG